MPNHYQESLTNDDATPSEPVTISPPTKPCHNCGSKKFWLRNTHFAEYLCNTCHPCPTPDKSYFYEAK